MKHIEKLFIGIGLFSVICITGAAIWQSTSSSHKDGHVYPANKYGAFLAAQHAIYVNDFDSASKFAKSFQDRDLPIIKNTLVLSDFLTGRLPDDPALAKADSSAPMQLINDAYSILENDWAAVYARHKKDESTLAAPLRIWSGVATGKSADVLKFVDSMATNDSWKHFVRGMIYAETAKPAAAAKEFAQVKTDFLNINDYLYLIAFYNEHDMVEKSTKLLTEFTEKPGGMFMLDSIIAPKWSDYSGYNHALTFSLVQSVSHTQVMLFSDLSLLLLRFAEIVQGDKTAQNDAINYYLGQYFFNNGGDYKKFFDAIDPLSPFYPFSVMKTAEKSGKISELERATRANPLFVPAITKLVAKYIQSGDQNKAIRVVNRALDNKNLTEAGRSFFLKTRAQIHMTFGDLDAAQDDIRAAADILPMDAGILAIQSRIWSGQGRELDTAYEYAIALVHKNPADVELWDVLGLAVAAREGPQAGLDIIERVGQISYTCSSLFEHLGDLYAEIGNEKQARDAYLRAIDLSDDGLSIVPVLERKLKRLK